MMDTNPNNILADINKVDLLAFQIWLRDRALSIDSSILNQPFWRAFLWALLHPIKYAEHRASFYALNDAIDELDIIKGS